MRATTKGVYVKRRGKWSGMGFGGDRRWGWVFRLERAALSFEREEDVGLESSRIWDWNWVAVRDVRACLGV